MTGPYQVVRDFEAALCEYTGARYAVTVNSCTMALTLAVAWALKSVNASADLRASDYWGYRKRVEIPKRTYVGVPYAIIEAGGVPTFRDEDWRGAYQLKPLPVWDSARWFTSGMYDRFAIDQEKYIADGDGSATALHAMLCVSFHASKTLGHSQGGAVLHDNAEADDWLRRARFDGRAEGVAPKDDTFPLARAWHCYMSADVAAALLLKLHSLPRNNAPLPNDPYPDLSQLEAFR